MEEWLGEGEGLKEGDGFEGIWVGFRWVGRGNGFGPGWIGDWGGR